MIINVFVVSVSDCWHDSRTVRWKWSVTLALMSCCHRVCSFLWFCCYSSCQTRTLRLSLRWASAFSRRQLHCSMLVEASTLHWAHSCLLMSRTHLPVGWWSERQQQWQVLVARPMDWHIAVIEQTLELVISHLIPAEMIALVRQFAPTYVRDMYMYV